MISNFPHDVSQKNLTDGNGLFTVSRKGLFLQRLTGSVILLMWTIIMEGFSVTWKQNQIAEVGIGELVHIYYQGVFNLVFLVKLWQQSGNTHFIFYYDAILIFNILLEHAEDSLCFICCSLVFNFMPLAFTSRHLYIGTYNTRVYQELVFMHSTLIRLLTLFLLCCNFDLQWTILQSLIGQCSRESLQKLTLILYTLQGFSQCIIIYH